MSLDTRCAAEEQKQSRQHADLSGKVLNRSEVASQGSVQTPASQGETMEVQDIRDFRGLGSFRILGPGLGVCEL